MSFLRVLLYAIFWSVLGGTSTQGSSVQIAMGVALGLLVYSTAFGEIQKAWNKKEEK